MPTGGVASPSFWLADLDESLTPRSALDGDENFDVVIVGAGYTGLWTAYYLATRDPALRIAIVEGQIAGFGASGRNGGWCSSHHHAVDSWIRGRERDGAIALQRAMFGTIDEVGRITAYEGIDCDFAKSGYLTVATNAAVYERLRGLVASLHGWGFSDADYRWLDEHESNARVQVQGALGGAFSPHAAAVQPAKLARGLARSVEKYGVRIFERSPARTLGQGEVVTDHGRIRAETVLRCTEGYTRNLPGLRRKLVAMHSLMVVTEPLPEAFWKEVGAADRVLFGDADRLLTYAQRTADGRIAIGTGGRYFYGSAICDYFPPDSSDFAAAERSIVNFFPQLRGVAIAHRWGGALGIPRDSRPFVRFDPGSRTGTAGGYIGSGVGASNLAGRTLADLVSGRDTERTHYPWVQHSPPDWEREPLRWLAVTSALKLALAADRGEQLGRPARLRSALFGSVFGH